MKMNIQWISHKNFSYFIISAFNIESDINLNTKVNSFLEDSIYLLDYTIIKIGSEKDSYKSDALFCFNLNRTSDDIRKDVLYLLSKYSINSAIIKYIDESLPKKVYKSGEETLLNIIEWSNDTNVENYFYNGIRFSFKEMRKYYTVKDKLELKNGMVVEYLNNNTWISKVIENIDIEWGKMYKLLSKYERLRY